ncbi:MAG: HEAT repeat domain-containing protein [Planctomycetota bacterium]|jgi:HEAT repeat protein
MSNNKLKQASLAVGAVALTAETAGAAKEKVVDELIVKLKDKNDKVRSEALLSAGGVGAPAVKSLAKVMADKDTEVMRAGKRALWKIVRYAGRPRARDEKNAVVTELISLLGDDQPTLVRREVLWMLSEISGRTSIKPIAALLSNKELREDARMVLQRIPGKQSVAALKKGLKAAPKDFKLNIAQSLRKRGVKVRGLACVKLVPTKKTNIQPLK